MNFEKESANGGNKMSSGAVVRGGSRGYFKSRLLMAIDGRRQSRFIANSDDRIGLAKYLASMPKAGR